MRDFIGIDLAIESVPDATIVAAAPSTKNKAKCGSIKKLEDSPMKMLLLAFEKTKSSIRAKVEHPLHVIKNLFGYRKVRYKGLAKNHARDASMGEVRLEYGLAAVKPSCQVKQTT